MSLWGTFRRFLSGAAYRSAGLQLGVPGYYNTRSSVPVTVDTALQLSAVWACVKLYAETIGSLDINVYNIDQKTGAKTLAKDHPLMKLFSGRVNQWQTRQEYFETITYQLILLGNNFSAIQRNVNGDIISLLPLMSPQMETRLELDSSKTFLYNDGVNIRAFAAATIWHNMTFGNGVYGLSPIGYARNSLGIAQAAEEVVAKIYHHGGKPSGVLMLDKVLTPEQRKSIKDSFSELAEGNNDRLFVLEAGMKYQQVSLSPQDIELLASRRFQIEDIARFHGVPSVLINDTATSTAWGSGIQQIVAGWYKLALRPILERYEASMEAWLLKPDERGFVKIEFDMDCLLRGDYGARTTANKDAVQGGLLTPNEARSTEGKPPLPGGDKLFMQQQMLPIDDPNRGKQSSQGNLNGN